MTNNFLQQIESSRISVQKKITEAKKKLAEQYFTPLRVSKTMSKMFSDLPKGTLISAFDPCCGVGNLAASLLSDSLERSEKIHLTLVERDSSLVAEAKKNFCKIKEIEINEQDFFDFIQSCSRKFDRIILNPPYSKMAANSKAAKIAKSMLGHNETNLYSAFIACCLEMLTDRGELVAIVPRSFCNGTMFKNFRYFLFSRFYLHEIYLFESRKIFDDNSVLQEMLILKVSRLKSLTVKVSHESISGEIRYEHASIEKILFVGDEHKFIHIPIVPGDDILLAKMAKFHQTLLSVGCRASTGKVVDFRSVKWLRKKKSDTTVRLLYQDAVCTNTLVDFSSRAVGKYHYIKIGEKTNKWLVKKGNFVLVRRISFKEAKNRIICSPLFNTDFESDVLAIENHLNYIWGEHVEISKNICAGLAAFLSTPSVDQYIRRFSGHTQINATDLNSLPIPTLKQLEKFGNTIKMESFSSAHQMAEKKFFG